MLALGCSKDFPALPSPSAALAPFDPSRAPDPSSHHRTRGVRSLSNGLAVPRKSIRVDPGRAVARLSSSPTYASSGARAAGLVGRTLTPSRVPADAVVGLLQRFGGLSVSRSRFCVVGLHRALCPWRPRRSRTARLRMKGAGVPRKSVRVDPRHAIAWFGSSPTCACSGARAARSLRCP